MHKLLARIIRALPHLVIALSLMTLVFFCIDRVNPIMAFMTSELSKWVFASLAILSICVSVSMIARQWHIDDRRAARRARAEAAASNDAPSEEAGSPSQAEAAPTHDEAGAEE